MRVSDTHSRCPFCEYTGDGFRISAWGHPSNHGTIRICPRCNSATDTSTAVVNFGPNGADRYTVTRTNGQPLISKAETERIADLPHGVDASDPSTWPDEARP